MNRGVNWFGIRGDVELVSIGGTLLTEWKGVIGAVAAYEAHRNRGYATSIVTQLVKKIKE
jgi:predicted GNAT family acetyltransferase